MGGVRVIVVGCGGFNVIVVDCVVCVVVVCFVIVGGGVNGSVHVVVVGLRIVFS